MIVTIVSKLVYFTYFRDVFTTYLLIGVSYNPVILSTSRTSQYIPQKAVKNGDLYTMVQNHKRVTLNLQKQLIITSCNYKRIDSRVASFRNVIFTSPNSTPSAPLVLWRGPNDPLPKGGPGSWTNVVFMCVWVWFGKSQNFGKEKKQRFHPLFVGGSNR